MRRFIIIGLLFLSPFCYAKSDVQIVNDAKEAVRKELSQKYKQGECERWKIMASGGAIAEGSAIAKCDNDFNPSYGFDFSSIEVKETDRGVSVCGIVSGRTDLSRIGGRFVYENKTGHVTMKPSKFPMASLASSGELGKGQIKIENKQFEIVSKLYCK
ncbi:hypothetical protein AB3X26_11090 [Raoultella planticola]|uniref:hypothetical protein n=1 Tax=Raoultella planticola TaxID=575 RepID=UPI00349F8062